MHSPSKCQCGAKIPYLKLIPVFGYLVARGRCSACEAKIPRSHLVEETVAFVLGWIASAAALSSLY